MHGGRVGVKVLWVVELGLGSQGYGVKGKVLWVMGLESYGLRV